MRVLLLSLFFFFRMSGASYSQADSLDWWISGLVRLDSVTVTAQRAGFDLQEFIRLVREDDSFYQAFQQLRITNYLSEQAMEFYDQNGQVVATHYSKTRQTVQDSCRRMEFLELENTGKMLKRKDYRYYTAKMLDHIFYTHGTVCPEAEAENRGKTSRMDKHQEELKKLIFQPGTEAEVPFIGRKTAIFSEKQYPYYDFAVQTDTFQGVPCYHFQAQLKPAFQDHKEDKTIVKQMNTWFSKEDFQVLFRDYQLVNQGLLSFEVHMQIELQKQGAVYLPHAIIYKGRWNIPGKKEEDGQFSLRFLEYSPMPSAN